MPENGWSEVIQWYFQSGNTFRLTKQCHMLENLLEIDDCLEVES